MSFGSFVKGVQGGIGSMRDYYEGQDLREWRALEMDKTQAELDASDFDREKKGLPKLARRKRRDPFLSQFGDFLGDALSGQSAIDAEAEVVPPIDGSEPVPFEEDEYTTEAGGAFFAAADGGRVRRYAGGSPGGVQSEEERLRNARRNQRSLTEKVRAIEDPKAATTERSTARLTAEAQQKTNALREADLRAGRGGPDDPFKTSDPNVRATPKVDPYSPEAVEARRAGLSASETRGATGRASTAPWSRTEAIKQRALGAARTGVKGARAVGAKKWVKGAGYAGAAALAIPGALEVYDRIAERHGLGSVDDALDGRTGSTGSWEEEDPTQAIPVADSTQYRGDRPGLRTVTPPGTGELRPSKPVPGGEAAAPAGAAIPAAPAAPVTDDDLTDEELLANFDPRRYTEDKIPQIKVTDWDDYEKDLVESYVMHMMPLGDAEAKAHEVTLKKQHNGFMHNLSIAEYALQMGDLEGVRSAIRAAGQYMPSTTDYRVVLHTGVDGKQYPVVYSVDEDTGEKVGQPVLLTQDFLRKLKRNFSQPATFAEYAEGRKLNQEDTKIKQKDTELEQGWATVDIGRHEAVTKRGQAEAEARYLDAGGTASLGSKLPYSALETQRQNYFQSFAKEMADKFEDPDVGEAVRVVLEHRNTTQRGVRPEALVAAIRQLLEQPDGMDRLLVLYNAALAEAQR